MNIGLIIGQLKDKIPLSTALSTLESYGENDLHMPQLSRTWMQRLLHYNTTGDELMNLLYFNVIENEYIGEEYHDSPIQRRRKRSTRAAQPNY